MKQAGELEILLSQTIAATDKPGCYSNFLYHEPIKIKFNRHYFETVKLLINELSQLCQKEKNAWFVDKELIKFIELGQMFLNCFCVQATFFPENPNYNSFELAIFYLAYLNLASRYKFNNLAAVLGKLKSSILHESNHLSLINTNLMQFYNRFCEEIKLFAAQFDLHLSSTKNIDNEYVTDIVSRHENYEQLFSVFMNPKLHILQRQLIIKLMQFNYLPPLKVYSLWSGYTDGFIREMTDENNPEILQDRLANHNKKFYLGHSLLLNLPSFKRENVRRIIELPYHDFNNLILNFIVFAHIDFCKVKLPKEIKGCVFRACIFSEDNIKSTIFSDCHFDNCNFSRLTISGAFKSCRFLYCSFLGASFEWLKLYHCDFSYCSLEKTDWYKVSATCLEIIHSTLVDSAIQFSNLNGAKLRHVNLTNTIYEGTQVNLNEATDCNWTNTNLEHALFLSFINLSFKDYLWLDVADKLMWLFQTPQRYQHILISSDSITTKLNEVMNDETPVNQVNYKARFRQLLGWILCATDRLSSYCEFYEENKNVFKFSTSLSIMENLAGITKLAINLLNNNYLTLYDRCHISYMTRNMVNNGIFKYQQYQDVMYKLLAPKKVYLNPYFSDNEKYIHLEINSENAIVDARFCKRESLAVIQQLPTTLKRIESLLAEMRNQLVNNQNVNARPGR